MKNRRAGITNWEGTIVTVPKAVVQPQTVNELKAVVRNTNRYPSPVRAIGSNYSPTRCAVADGGTLVDMRLMNNIIEVGPDFVRVQAGALLIDVARELQRHGLQFYVNADLGNMSMGSAACGGTRDASMPGQYGQLSSYVTAMKLVTPHGHILNVTEAQPDLLRLMRSSYGLLGIVYEITFKVRPLQTVSLAYEAFDIDSFCSALPRLLERQQAMKLYLFPFRNSVTVEFRRFMNGRHSSKTLLWGVRNWSVRTFMPLMGHLVTKSIPIRSLRYYCIDGMNHVMQVGTVRALSGASLIPTNQIMRFPKRSGIRKVSYSTWAFPEAHYPTVLRDYIEFCRDYYRDNGYRCNMVNAGYRIAQDASSLLSYSFSGPVFTLEPVSTGDEGWEDFLVDYNEFCSEHGGVPIFNQTKAVTHKQALRAFGERLRSFCGLRQRVDPNDRFLNAYFMQLLG